MKIINMVPIEFIRQEIKTQSAYSNSPELLKVKAIQKVMKILTLKNEKKMILTISKWARITRDIRSELQQEEAERQMSIRDLKMYGGKIIGHIFERRELGEKSKAFHLWKDISGFEGDISKLKNEIDKMNSSQMSSEKETIGYLLKKSIKDGKKIKQMIDKFKKKKDSENMTQTSFDTAEVNDQSMALPLPIVSNLSVADLEYLCKNRLSSEDMPQNLANILNFYEQTKY